MSGRAPLHPALVVFGGAGGVLATVAGAFWLDASADWPAPLRVGLYLALLGLCVTGACLLAETLFPALNGRGWRKYAAKSWKYLLPLGVLPPLLWGGALQALYQWDFRATPPRHVYMLIDKSGSMIENDPDDERLAAVNRMLAAFNPQDRVEIISFDHQAEVVYPLARMGDARDSMAAAVSGIQIGGGTEFNVVLRLAYERVVANQSYPYPTTVILLSDGFSPLDVQTLRPFMRAGIPVSTVGFALPNMEGAFVLEFIAAETLGQFVLVDAVEDLDFALGQMYQAETRFMLDAGETAFSLLPFLLYAALGAWLAFTVAFLLDNRFTFRPLLAGGVTGGLAAGLLLGLGVAVWPGPVGLLVPNILVGGLFALFTLFARIPTTASPTNPQQQAGTYRRP